jgi:hypothetical protein
LLRDQSGHKMLSRNRNSCLGCLGNTQLNSSAVAQPGSYSTKNDHEEKSKQNPGPAAGFCRRYRERMGGFWFRQWLPSVMVNCCWDRISNIAFRSGWLGILNVLILHDGNYTSRLFLRLCEPDL